MIVNLSEIEYSKEFSHHFKADWFNGEISNKENTELKTNSDVFVKAEVFKFDGGYTFTGNVEFDLSYNCVRCIEPCVTPYKCKLNITLLPLKKEESNPDDNEEINLHYYSSEVLDLSDVILQHLLLELPAYPLCSNDCKGLCQKCGINLNKKTCFCDKGFINPKMAVLKDFKVTKH